VPPGAWPGSATPAACGADRKEISVSSFVALFVASDVAAVLVALYLLPVLVGWARHAPDLGAVAVINILLGWTLLGWVAALALALRAARPAGPVVHLTQYLPPTPLPPGYDSAGWAGPGGPSPRLDPPPPLALGPRLSWPDNPAHGSAGYDPLQQPAGGQQPQATGE
jgi:hypothetical protein